MATCAIYLHRDPSLWDRVKLDHPIGFKELGHYFSVSI